MPGLNYRLLPALATNSPPDCLLNASRPQLRLRSIVCYTYGISETHYTIKQGSRKKICVAKIFWEKEQPSKSPPRRKAVRIKGRIATQWATLCPNCIPFSSRLFPKLRPLMADVVVYNSSLSHLQKDDKIVAEILHRLRNAF